ncbi:Alanine-anticapsin ligase BacD [Moraxella cuniculi]|uniref:Alanine-anticapsin ligase BacD n=1 Tax=Moraxella cuniculi TaxID=34061 RepID=A0A448GYL8_9GAMM|nr:Alanine-anticapsin ligase BacD [Moraxella cuniculi]
MWVVIIGANEAILRRAPRGLKIIDIRQTKEHFVFRDDYIQIGLNAITYDAITHVLGAYCSKLTICKFVSFTEGYLLLAAKLNECYHLRANSVSCVQRLCDKEAMRHCLAEHFIMWSKLTKVSHLQSLLNSINFDVIVKPVDGFGSRLIGRYFVGKTDTELFVQKYQELEYVLVEEYIHGDEYSVEALSDNGQHKIIAITKKFIDADFIETGHIMPPKLDDASYSLIIQKVKEFLDLVELQEGPSHTEIIINQTGVHIVEGHSRTGGDRIVSLVRLTTGVDLIEAYLHQLAHIAYTPAAIKAKFAHVIFTNFVEGATYVKMPDLQDYGDYIDEIEINISPGECVIRPECSAMRHTMAVVYANDFDECVMIAHKIRNQFLTQAIVE